MKMTFLSIAFALGLSFAPHSYVQTAGGTPFPKGELSTTKNHMGDIWLEELNVGDSTFDPGIAVATYGPGAKLDWHIHPGGQVLMITEGTGFYQEKGKPKQIVHKGDVIKSPAGVPHWHAAAPNSTFAYIAVTPVQKGKTVWLEPVTEKEIREQVVLAFLQTNVLECYAYAASAARSEG